MQFNINLYEEIEEINILDTGTVDIEIDHVQSVVDLALEIAYRRQENLPIENFLVRLDEIFAEYM